MAFKKTKNTDVAVEVSNPVEEIVENATEAVKNAPEVVEEEQKSEDNGVVIDPEAVSKSIRKPGNVRIKMRENHKCTIAMVRYDFKKGECYHVPENVKRILDEHGLLAPLN